MIGHLVHMKLNNPAEEAYGELRQQNSEGVWIYRSTGYSIDDTLKFYPMHRVVEMRDRGRPMR